MDKNTLKKLVRIAGENIPALRDRGDLKRRYHDDLDFFETSVWSLSDALVAAYELGRAEACEGCGYKNHSNAIAKLHNCNDCGAVIDCEHTPKVGNWARINCPLWKPQKPVGAE